MARRAAADRSPHGGSARLPARGPLQTPRGVRPSVAHALTFKEGVSHGDLATELSADSAEPAPSVAGPERLTGAYRAARTLPVFPFGGSRAGIRRDSAFQSAVPPRSFRLRVSGAVAPSAPAPGGTGLSRGDRPAVTAMIGGARPLSTAGRGSRGHPRHRPPSTSPRRLAEGYTSAGRESHHTSGPFNVTSALGRGILVSWQCAASENESFNVTSALGRGTPLPEPSKPDQSDLPSTSPRRWAEGYPGELDEAALGREPSSMSPRRWAEGYPRRWSRTRSRSSSFNVTSVLGRGIHRERGPTGANHREPSTSPRRSAEGYQS